MSIRTKCYVSYTLLAIWMVVIFLFSAQDADVSKSQSGVFVGLLDGLVGDMSEDWLTFLTRKAAHILVYFVLGLLVYNLVRTYGLSRKRTMLISILVAFGYASFDEIHQLFIPGRSGELRDVLIDTTAATIGVGVYALIDNLKINRIDKNAK